MGMTPGIRRAMVTLLGVLLLAGCAAMRVKPTPITDVRQIAGKWEGTISLGSGEEDPYYLTINPDGSMVANWGVNWQWGKITLGGFGGTANFEVTPATIGTITYYGESGGRSLVLKATFEDWSANVTPVK